MSAQRAVFFLRLECMGRSMEPCVARRAKHGPVSTYAKLTRTLSCRSRKTFRMRHALCLSPPEPVCRHTKLRGIYMRPSEAHRRSQSRFKSTYGEIPSLGPSRLFRIFRESTGARIRKLSQIALRQGVRSETTLVIADPWPGEASRGWKSFRLRPAPQRDRTPCPRNAS
jgi:hypothetical protein